MKRERIIKSLDKINVHNEADFVSSEGERMVLSSNKVSARSPSLELLEDSFSPEELIQLNQLLDILIQGIEYSHSYD